MLVISYVISTKGKKTAFKAVMQLSPFTEIRMENSTNQQVSRNETDLQPFLILAVMKHYFQYARAQR